MTVICPHCQYENKVKPIERINVNRTPEMRKMVQDLSCFRTICANCGQHMLAVQPCLYHDREARFMVWLWPDASSQPPAGLTTLQGYTLRLTESPNAFREKICILEQGLDDCAVELMKLMLYMQLRHDLDVVELLFHELDRQHGELRFVAVLSDGVEQYIAMPGSLYARCRQDVQESLFCSRQDFVRVDMDWAAQSLELLHESMLY